MQGYNTHYGEYLTSVVVQCNTSTNVISYQSTLYHAEDTQLWAACVLTGQCLHLSIVYELLVSHLKVENSYCISSIF